MKPILPTHPNCFQVNILLCDAYSNMVLACLLEPLRVVRDELGAQINWTYFAVGDQPLRSSSGMTIAPDHSVAKAAHCDLLILIGGDRFLSDAQKPALRRALRLAKTAEVVIAADTGAWLLAAAGYLNGRRATLHWQLLDEFADRFPQVDAVPAPHVADGRWMTCGSASAALDLMLLEIARRFGPAARFDAAAMFLNNPIDRPGHVPGFGNVQSHPNPCLRRALGVMAAHSEKPLTLSRIARESGIALRSMARLFETELGQSPGRCYTLIRIARARELMTQAGLGKAEVATRCGFSSAGSLARAMKRARSS